MDVEANAGGLSQQGVKQKGGGLMAFLAKVVVMVEGWR
jgi:hypothetical protein